MGIINWLDPHVDKYILTTAGEHKVLEVKKHWVASAWPGVRLGIGLVILVSAFAFTGAVYWVIFLLGLVIGVQALYRMIEEYRDSRLEARDDYYVLAVGTKDLFLETDHRLEKRIEACERERRKLLLGVGISVFVVGLLVLVVRRFAGNYLVDALTGNPDAKKAVDATWAIETALLRNVGVNAVIYGIVIIFGAWIAGPSRPARWVRRVSAPTMRDHPVVLYGLVTLVLFLILLAGPTDAQRIFPLLILFAFAYAGVEVLRRETMREFPPPAQREVPA